MSDNTNNFSNVGVNLDYQRSFKRKGEYLTLSYKFNNSPNGGEATTSYDEIDSYRKNFMVLYAANIITTMPTRQNIPDR